jgi:hypothetical protein
MGVLAGFWIGSSGARRQANRVAKSRSLRANSPWMLVNWMDKDEYRLGGWSRALYGVIVLYIVFGKVVLSGDIMRLSQDLKVEYYLYYGMEFVINFQYMYYYKPLGLSFSAMWKRIKFTMRIQHEAAKSEAIYLLNSDGNSTQLNSFIKEYNCKTTDTHT